MVKVPDLSRYKRIVKVTKRPYGDHGGHLLVCELECGHVVEHLSGSAHKVGRQTTCPTCR